MIAFDSFAESDASGNTGGTLLFSFNNVGGTFLLCACCDDNSVDPGILGFYGGDQLTELFNGLLGAAHLWVGYLVNPKTGANNLSLNKTGTMAAFRTGVITFTGVDANNPLGGNNNASESSNTNNFLGTTVTVQGTSGLIVDAFMGSRVTAGNAKTPQTEKMNNTGLWGGAVDHLAGMSIEAHTGSNITMTWENFTGQSGATKKIIYATELLPSTFTPKIQII